MSELSGDLNQDSSKLVEGKIMNSGNIKAQHVVKSHERISARKLHKYVLGLIGLFMLALITYPIAMARVSQKEKFAPYQSHLKSLTPEYKPIEPK